ncbi:hypothetical protein SMW93_003604 [Cronobacter sakazakii]|nr:hypothetical protein [Cronobacter sakazakii]ELY4752641.1 hypothetical protein [Cronobacter sakazakii]ELY5779437.1 hypothetical protein [Cronobacter sakazakii]
MMAIYKITYQVSGDAGFRDVNIESDYPLSDSDPEVIEAAMRDSAHHYRPEPGVTSVQGLRITMVTEVK